MTLSKTNFIFVDYENTQKVDTDKLKGNAVRIVLFVSESQKNVPIELVKRLLNFEGSAEIYESTGSGKNALDFQIAFYAGRIFEREPLSTIHVVSKDKGFDPLIKHMRNQGRQCSRVEAFEDLPFLKKAERPKIVEKTDLLKATLDEKIQNVLSRFSKVQANSRPRKRKTLASALNAQFQKQLDADGIQEVISELSQRGYINIGESESVTYNIPAGKS